jgi:hypothetical protein
MQLSINGFDRWISDAVSCSKLGRPTVYFP